MSNYIIHYASKYYDPVKAHQYYEEHKKLKGRNSTAQLNEKGKEAARYVKEQLTNERKGKVEEHKNYTDNTIENLKNDKNNNIESHKNQMQNKIDSIKKELSELDPIERRKKKAKFLGEIQKLRDQNKAFRENLQLNFKSNSTNLRTDHRETKVNLKNEYDQKYSDELDKIRSDSKFIKVKKKR